MGSLMPPAVLYVALSFSSLLQKIYAAAESGTGCK